MVLKWTMSVQRELVRLYSLLARVNAQAAADVARKLVDAAKQLVCSPRLGARFGEFAPREVRCLIVGDYELRYEIAQTAIYVLCLWQTRNHP
jgi:plasmid stabilization system protein ParE